MKEQIPLVDKEYLLEKFQGKGGWTFARIPEIQASEKTPFGWVRVCGSISAKTDKIKVKRIVDTINTISKTIKL